VNAAWKRIFIVLVLLGVSVLVVMSVPKGALFRDSFSQTTASDCSCEDCFLISDVAMCLPTIARERCFLDEAIGTYLIFKRVTEKGSCALFGFPGQKGVWYQRLQWSGRCGDCCENPGGGEKFDFSPEDIGPSLTSD